MFSTLREIAFVSNCMRIMDSGIEPKKIKEIVMKDGGTFLIIEHVQRKS